MARKIAIAARAKGIPTLLKAPHAQLPCRCGSRHTIIRKSPAGCCFLHCVRTRYQHSERDVSPDPFSDWNLMREKLWREFFADRSRWWDHRSEKVHKECPDFEHKETREGLWIVDNLTPPWVKAELATERHGWSDPKSDKKVIRGKIWRDFFSDPSQWWDNRSEKDNPRYPDFEHKKTQQGLWIIDNLTPPWVKAELATVTPSLLQSNIYSWNVRLRRHLKVKDYQKTLNLFQRMQLEGMMPDKVTFVAVLSACSSLGSLEEGRRAHEQIVQRGWESETYVATSLVDMYAKCGSIEDAWSVFNRMPKRSVVSWNVMIDMYAKCRNMEDAWSVFNRMPERSVVSWNVMITGYVKSEQGLKGLELFRRMQQEGVEPNTVTYKGALNACASVAALEEGRCVHKQIIQRGCESDIYVATCLVDMYAKCGSIEDAWIVFNKMQQRDVVSWNAMIGGYVKSEQGLKALEVFLRMQQEGVEPNTVTFVEALNACATVVDLEEGRRVHEQIRQRGCESDVYVASCLVDMYAKCGSIADSHRVFSRMRERTVVSWNAMIGGYAMHGHSKKAIKLFKKMDIDGVTIDKITFTCLLSACSNEGLVKEGLLYFKTMTSHYNVLPTREHYICMVDLLGRAGWLEEAEEITKNMPLERETSVWIALLGACRTHGNIEMAERAAKKCWELDPENASAHVLLSNIYAAAEK